MRKSTTRAVRATATVASVAAFGAAFAGTASAAAYDGEASPTSNSGASAPSIAEDNLGGEAAPSSLAQPDLMRFDMPASRRGHDDDSGSNSGFGGFAPQSFGDYMQSFGRQPNDTYDDKSFCYGDGRDNGSGTHRSYSNDGYGYTFGDNGNAKGSHYDYNKGEKCKDN